MFTESLLSVDNISICGDGMSSYGDGCSCCLCRLMPLLKRSDATWRNEGAQMVMTVSTKLPLYFSSKVFLANINYTLFNYLG